MICVAALSLPLVVVVAADESTPEKIETCDNPEQIPLVSIEELEKFNGKVKGETIYLSIFGEVYDVTKGAEFYAEGAGYHAFAGRDAAVPFITGIFTEEEAAKSTDVLSDADLMSMKSWLEFYQKEERYPFVGRLVGRYYDSEGKETEEMQRVLTRWENFQPPEKKERKKPKTGSE
ncbi:hypothetical protein MHU86_11985 [Fragilaria crotonensis]|nr:hypothetical protein MHU86_11985 [Fragilaria crotonensis]